MHLLRWRLLLGRLLLLLLLLEPVQVLKPLLSLLFIDGVPLDVGGLLLLLLPLMMLPPLFLPEAVGVCRLELSTRARLCCLLESLREPIIAELASELLS